MLLHRFRLHASRIVWALIVSLAALDGAILAPHADDCHEAACAAAAIEHDASAHRFGPAQQRDGADDHTLHCLACHLTRSFRSGSDLREAAAPAPDAGVPVHLEEFTALHSAPLAQPPLRSPPQSPDRA